MTGLEASRRWVAQPRHRAVIAWVWFGMVIALAVELGALSVLNRETYANGGIASFVFLAVAAPAWAAVGALIVTRTGNLVGWILMAVATVMVGSPAAEQYIAYAVITSPGSLPLVGVAARLGSSTMVFLWGIGLLFLVFPTGRPLSPRWRPVMWALVAGAAVHAVGWIMRLDDRGWAVIVGPWNDQGVILRNRFAVPGLNWLWQAGVAVALLASGIGIVSLVLRFRRSSGEERAQLRWLSFVGILVALAFVVGLLVPPLRDGDLTFMVMFICIVFGIPVACAIAILKYRLYDIDLVIRKTVVFGLLAVFITVVYAAIVAVVSQVAGGTSRAGSFLAAATLAVAFAPVRDRARRIADRLVYGKRATPYEVLAEFSDRVGGAYASDDVLNRMVQVLEEGTGAVGARVLLQVGSERWEAAAIGERGDETLVPVTHNGEDLGALAVSMPPTDPMNPAKRQLVEDLASQAGLVLRNVKLIEELKASRQRLVAAQDEERRKIERNLHDGAQQQLVALAVQLKLAERMVGRDPERERAVIAQLGAQANDALENLRDLARGIYPPLLADQGLPAALEAQARKALVPTSVEADAIGRFPREVEAAIYFSCLEALQNVAKYAEASRASIALSNGDGALRFTVTDDGRGFDASSTSYGTGLQGIADRLAAIGGEVDVTSAPGAGTTVAGWVSVEAGA